MKSIYFIFIALISGYSLAIGQITPPSANPDTVENTETEEIIIENSENIEVKEIETYADQFVPRKASLYAAILPGSGQVYNKKYWKLPIVYGGFIALGFTVDFYNDRYKLLRKELFKTLNESGYSSPYGNETQLRNNLDSERRDRDFYVIMIGVLYLLQIADAHIDAHLKEFDLNPNLQVSLEPAFSNESFGYNAGLSLKLKF
ncbi:DUF5683 domain-containing protein [Fulvivirga ulvae]|uniref:DUF5683 domain-containing protein n=1 Tax=Fulvivirga ulvae TaxID=2904245 RepID=UPI001F281C97|nr:DUF5683 domain-containing protein [Fulvivirga ulvae]UII30305.1 DUF5683 domain-containing protein [Fulvivirga ulvae]